MLKWKDVECWVVMAIAIAVVVTCVSEVISNHIAANEEFTRAQKLLQEGGGFLKKDAVEETWIYPLEKSELAFETARKSGYTVSTVIRRPESNRVGKKHLEVRLTNLLPEK